MQDILFQFKQRYQGRSPEDLLKGFRVKLFLEKVDEWVSVMSGKKMSKEQQQLFIELQEATSDIVSQIELEKEKVYGYACIAHELHLRNQKLNKENKELLDEVESLRKSLETML